MRKWLIREWVKFFLTYLALVVGIVGIGLGFNFVLTQKPSVNTSVDKAINSADWFEQQYGQYLLVNSKVEKAQRAAKAFKSELALRRIWRPEDTTKYLHLTKVLYNLAYQKELLVATYNARSGMIAKELFKSKAAPYRLPLSEDN